jgi:hypothetical protein
MGIRADLIARRDAIGAELRAVQNTDRHIQYKQGLYEELLAIARLLSDPTLDQESTDDLKPFEVEHRGLT